MNQRIRSLERLLGLSNTRLRVKPYDVVIPKRSLLGGPEFATARVMSALGSQQCFINCLGPLQTAVANGRTENVLQGLETSQEGDYLSFATEVTESVSISARHFEIGLYAGAATVLSRLDRFNRDHAAFTFGVVHNGGLTTIKFFINDRDILQAEVVSGLPRIVGVIPQ